MSGTPPDAYPAWIASEQWAMLTGGAYDSTTSSNNIVSLSTYSTGLEDSAILDLINDLMTANTCGDNPYNSVTIYSATSSGQPYQAFSDSVNTASCYLDYLYTYSCSTSGAGWLTYFGNLHNIASCYFDEEPLTDSVNAIEDRVWGRLVRELGTLNAGYAQANAVFTSSRIIAQALAVRDAARSIDEQEGKMAYDRAKYITELARAEAQRLVELDFDKFARLAAEAQLYQTLSKVKAEYERQYTGDTLEMDLRDTLWDLELWRHAQHGIGSIGGMNSMPQQPNPLMEALSTGLSVLSAIGPFLKL